MMTRFRLKSIGFGFLFLLIIGALATQEIASNHTTRSYLMDESSTRLEEGPPLGVFHTTSDPPEVNYHEDIWNATFGNDEYYDDDEGYDIEECEEGGFIVAGRTEGYGAGSIDMWLIRTDEYGNEMWNRTFGGSSNDGGHTVTECDNGDFVIAGYTYSFGGSQEGYVVRVAPNGTKLWEEHFGIRVNEVFWDVIECQNGELVVAGTSGGSSPDNDVYVVRLFANLTQIWGYTYNIGAYDVVIGISEREDGSFIAFGYTSQPGPYRFLAVLIGADGNDIIHLVYGPHRDGQYLSNSYLAYCFDECEDGGWIIGGDINPGPPQHHEWLIVRVAEDLSQSWWRIISGGTGGEQCLGVEALSDGGFALAGWTYSISGSTNWLIRTDNMGNRLWDHYYGSNYGLTNEVIQTENGDIVLVGFNDAVWDDDGDSGPDFGEGGRDVWILRIPWKIEQSPMVIDSLSDLELANEGHLGDGSISDPYSIADWIINPEGGATHGLLIDDIVGIYFKVGYCEFNDFSDGASIALSNVEHGQVHNNTCVGSRYGILCSLADDLLVEKNTFINSNHAGAMLGWVTNSEISRNSLANGLRGIELSYTSTGNTITNNTCSGNSDVGLILDSISGSNTLMFNILEENSVNVRDDSLSAANTFDFNYYSDYTGFDINPPEDIGDDPHPIPGAASNSDPDPLIIPPGRVPLIWNPEPTNQTFEYNVDILFPLLVMSYRGIDAWWISDTINFTVDSAGVITNQTSLGLEDYKITAWVNDTRGSEINSTFTLSVQTGPPAWDQEPVDQDVEFGTRFHYDLNATDPAGIDHWWLNDTSTFSINPITGVITDNFVLPIGIYGLQVWVNDTINMIQSATFDVTVQDTLPPAWTEAPADQFVEYPLGLRYDLNATDSSGIEAWWLDDTTNFEINGEGVVTNITTLSLQEYGLQVWVNDTLGHLQTVSFSIHVRDSTNPIWVTGPTDYHLEGGLDDCAIQLDAWDRSSIAYWTISDTTHFTITSGGLILNVTNLAIGNYEVVVNAYDPSDNFCTSTFSIIVEDTTAPEWLVSPSDQTIELGSSFLYGLAATDFYGIEDWWLNDTAYFSIDDGTITNATSLSLGTYGLEVSVSDGNGQVQSEVLVVVVQDTVAPTWTTVPTDQVLMEGDTYGIQLAATDLSGISAWSLSDTTHFTITQGGYFASVTSLPPGTYALEVTVYDGAGNPTSVEFTIEVQVNYMPLAMTAAGIGVVAVAGAFLYYLLFRRGGLSTLRTMVRRGAVAGIIRDFTKRERIAFVEGGFKG